MTRTLLGAAGRYQVRQRPVLGPLESHWPVVFGCGSPLVHHRRALSLSFHRLAEGMRCQLIRCAALSQSRSVCPSVQLTDHRSRRATGLLLPGRCRSSRGRLPLIASETDTGSPLTAMSPAPDTPAQRLANSYEARPVAAAVVGRTTVRARGRATRGDSFCNAAAQAPKVLRLSLFENM